MAGNDRRKAKDIPERSFGSGLLRSARDAISGRSRQIDDTVDEATGQGRGQRNRRNKDNQRKRGLRR